MLKKLRERRRKLDRKLERNQRLRQKALGLVRKLKHAGRNALAGVVQKVADALGERIKVLHADLREVDRKIEKAKEHRKGDEGKKEFLKFLESAVGEVEGGPLHQKIVSEMHGLRDWAWCSALVGYGLIKYGGFKLEELPDNPWYSGNWLTWDEGTRVTYAEREAADLLIFDWGDGGITDHVATYVGNGIKIGGNENDRVEKDAVPVGYIVGVVRVDWK